MNDDKREILWQGDGMELGPALSAVPVPVKPVPAPAPGRGQSKERMPMQAMTTR